MDDVVILSCTLQSCILPVSRSIVDYKVNDFKRISKAEDEGSPWGGAFGTTLLDVSNRNSSLWDVHSAESWVLYDLINSSGESLPMWPRILRTLRSFWSGLASQPLIGRPSNSELRSGGFLRVRLGDVFDNQRYKVLRKLGYGQYSTVWLARDDR